MIMGEQLSATIREFVIFLFSDIITYGRKYYLVGGFDENTKICNTGFGQ